MKKIVALSAVAFMSIAMFTSCKKDYTCTCNFNGVVTDFQLKNVKKSDAKKACDVYKVAGATCELK